MAFSANPLALSVPDPTFESWLRDSGYLEVLDQRTSDLHRISTTTTATATSSNSATADPPPVATAVSSGFFLLNVLNHIGILLSLITINPFSKLTNEDFARDTPPWTLGFVGSFDSYSFPSSRSQARMRVTENNKRYCRNYFTLFIVFFACSLYQIPIALAGLVSSLALWDLFAYCSKRWGLDNHPVTRECLLRLLQCATAVVIFVCNVQTAIIYALAVSYAVMMLHASFRKLTPIKQPTKGKPK
ncbi:putative prenylated rab acceptor PRA1 [Helianthus annuus]|uniref:PRA1 family protein n=1 Tax=Helianthus annuus TaxID=4232 RepID=A0A251SZS5_HELAN|nr:PRA1 family protein H [Helianthus annuus]KAF5776997.1 putative prenylated rab acceptor PRA1 [Helianthus annuus]KAJ0492165.1 putative prenylated rab acceptor P [Helianthus annuus]KAJ0504459.1 putative prenylated rab acceptor P [Helianthus annuus]KAJ0674176.1 putative prenylated rab acceptor P [Helianthus annuus]KAJ0861838.1 putative prenylated rab acceptor P [Helianthus annuus]